MTIKKAFEHLCNELKTIYDDGEATNIAKIVFEDCYQITQSQAATNFGEVSDLFENVIPRLLDHEPVHYITGRADFYGLQFKVNKNVLIPRSETEELVYWILNDHQESRHSLDVIDIGSGSGCIAVTLKNQRKWWRVFGMDESLDAVNVAVINAKKLKTEVEFFHFDFLDESKWSFMGMFDIIVSNPPYISNEEQDKMDEKVLRYEPSKALFPKGNDPLVFYKMLALFGSRHLKPGGRIYVEINEFMPYLTMEIFKNTYPDADIVLKNDLQGRPRMIRVRT